MRSPLKRITLVFVLIALLPVSFILYELNTLNKNEEIVREIYQNQLDAILYSVNQYSDDIIGSWANRVTIEMLKNAGALPPDSASGSRISSVLSQFPAVEHFYFSDLKGQSSLYGAGGGNDQQKQLILDKAVTDNSDRISKLITYYRGGFKKMEAVDTDQSDGKVFVFFVMGEDPDYDLGVMIVDIPSFIEDVLGPKMQTISQGKFIISAFHEANDSLVYSTESMDKESIAAISQQLEKDDQRKDFWLLPGYYLGISLKGATIDDLVKDRVTTSIIILSFLIFILTSGLVFLYRNIRREIHLSQAKSDFVSNVSHEIRTPLSLISMYAETLEMDRVTEEKKREYYSVIARETTRLSRIVNRILNFSQIEANKKMYESKPIRLNELCAEVLELYFFHLRDKGFTSEFIEDDSPAVIYGDRESIIEAFINLLDNAIKYSREKKHIVIRTGTETVFSFIEVSDAGIGIAKNYQAEIFDKFYRVPAGDVHNTKGSGLGLTLVKRTMEVHHGKIKVESSPGKGSTFRLYFPLSNKKNT
jgi:two-component system phosphate regulon sensor histidine kinase PhoR